MFAAIGRAIGRRVAVQAVDEYFASDKFEAAVTKAVDDAIIAELRKPEYANFRFIKHMQARLLEASPTMEPRLAFYTARDRYNAFLRDEKVAFGDARYDWSRSGARDLIQALEIDYWEQAA